MTWTVRYLRYYAPGEYEAETLSEAISVAMGYIEEGYAAPTDIIGPDGSVAVGKPTLSRIYSQDYGRISVAEIVSSLPTTEEAL